MALCYTHVEMFRPTGVKLVVRSLSYNILVSKEAANYGVEKKKGGVTRKMHNEATGLG